MKRFFILLLIIIGNIHFVTGGVKNHNTVIGISEINIVVDPLDLLLVKVFKEE